MKRILALIVLAAFCLGTFTPAAQAVEPKSPAQKRAVAKKTAKKKALHKAQKAKRSDPHKRTVVEPRHP
jgi:Ni/Co efflux regulator RcnB